MKSLKINKPYLKDMKDEEELKDENENTNENEN